MPTTAESKSSSPTPTQTYQRTLIKILLASVLILPLGTNFFLQSSETEKAETKPLLRVFPSYRKEECDWAIRWDICLSCMRIGRRYAQRIHFYPSGPYREHGCYSEEEGFFLMEE
ncbi:hypothetical protein EHQ76_08295 [Leptospira barantonii]|uniref:Uncharacterized protein n=1 Tax=Leptospira barantonii TaxID=2023184 RepID=A0A5F2BE20_9LEPT|nr:hypothetical protein [Leptospira barantonii]TGM03637.1 hypothetical protein EHQ76_08295 [Leptospira barantonii]